MSHDSSIKNISTLLSSQVVTMLIGMIIQVIIARLLLPEGRGVYAICIMFASMMGVITYLGNEYGIRYLLLRRVINLQEAFRYLLLTCAIALLISFAIFFIVKNFDIGFFGKATQKQFFLSLLLVPTQLISVQINVFLTINKKFKDAAKMIVYGEVFKLVVMSIALLQVSTVEMALMSMILTNLLIIFLYTARYDLFSKKDVTLKFSNLKSIYLYGFKSFFLTLNNFANVHVGTLILSFYMTNEKIGIYSIAYALVAKVQVIPDAINRFLVPRVGNELNESKGKYIILMTVMALLILCVAVTLFLVSFGDQLVYVIFGSSYLEAALLMKILFVGFSFKILSKPIEAYFNEISGEPSKIGKIQAMTLVFTTLLMIYLIPEYELIGVTIANLIGLLLGFGLVFYSFVRCLDKNELSQINPKKLIMAVKNTLIK